MFWHLWVVHSSLFLSIVRLCHSVFIHSVGLFAVWGYYESSWEGYFCTRLCVDLRFHIAEWNCWVIGSVSVEFSKKLEKTLPQWLTRSPSLLQSKFLLLLLLSNTTRQPLLWSMWNGLSLWLESAILWWQTMLTFSCASWHPPACHLLWNV